MEAKKTKKYISLTAVFLTAAVIFAAVSLVLSRREEAPPPKQIQEYSGSFPGISGSSGIFTTDAPGVRCRDFAVKSHTGQLLLQSSSAERSGAKLIMTNAVFDDALWPQITEWAAAVTADGIIKNISGTWINEYGSQGTFGWADGVWKLESAETSVTVSSLLMDRNEKIPVSHLDSLPDLPCKIPFTAGDARIQRIFSMPEMELQKMTVRTRDWDLHVSGGGWLMSRSAAGSIPELEGLVFNNISAAGTPDGHVRRSSGWIRRAALLEEEDETLLHTLAGGGLECTFTAWGMEDAPADWSLAAEKVQDHTVYIGRMKMELEECSLESIGGTITGSFSVRELTLPLPLEDMLVRLPSARMEVRADGTINCIALADAEVTSRERGHLFTLHGVSWIIKEGKAGDISGAGGSGKDFSWERFTADHEAGKMIFSNLSLLLPDGGFKVRDAELDVSGEGTVFTRTLTFSGFEGSGSGFRITGESGSLQYQTGSGIKGAVANAVITSQIYPDFHLQKASAEFSAPDLAAVRDFSCLLRGRLHDRDGLFADLEAEYYPEEGSWRGLCSLLTTKGKLSAVLVRDSGYSGWIIPLAGNSDKEFPSVLFPRWKGIVLDGIGSFEYDVQGGTEIDMIDASVGAGTLAFAHARGSWIPVNGPENPEGTLSCAFVSVNIPGTGEGVFEGRYEGGKLVPDTFSARFISGRCEYIGTDGNNWIMAVNDISGKDLAKIFLSVEEGSGWEGFTFSGSGIYSPAGGRWLKLSLSGIPSDSAEEIRTAVRTAAENIMEDASSAFFRDLLTDCYISNWYLEYSSSADTLLTTLALRPAEPLNYIFSGDVERPFMTPEEGEPGFYGKIEVQIDLPLCLSDDILSPKEF